MSWGPSTTVDGPHDTAVVHLRCLLSVRSEKGLRCASAIRCRCNAFDSLDDETLLNAGGEFDAVTA